MRHDEADEADRSGYGDCGSCQNGTADEDHEFAAFDVDAQMMCAFLAEQHGVQFPPVHPENEGTDDDKWKHHDDVIPAAHRDATEQPADDLP